MYILYCIVLCKFIGVSMKLGDQLVSVHLLEVCRAVSSSAQLLVERIVWLTPVGVASLLVSDLVSQEDLLGMMASLSWYLLTVCLIIFIHGFLVVPLVFFLVCRKNPYKLLLGMPAPLSLLLASYLQTNNSRLRWHSVYTEPEIFTC